MSRSAKISPCCRQSVPRNRSMEFLHLFFPEHYFIQRLPYLYVLAFSTPAFQCAVSLISGYVLMTLRHDDIAAVDTDLHVVSRHTNDTIGFTSHHRRSHLSDFWLDRSNPISLAQNKIRVADSSVSFPYLGCRRQTVDSVAFGNNIAAFELVRTYFSRNTTSFFCCAAVRLWGCSMALT